MRISQKLLPLLGILVITSLSLKKSYANASDSTYTLLSNKRVFPVIFLDPLECQINGGSYFINRKDYSFSLYSLVNLGFNKPVISRYTDKYSWEINFGAATFTQFELNINSDNTYLAGLVNNDYKLSGDFSFKMHNNIFRFRLFHLSSHLGDDYMLRNDITVPNDKSENYEQADLTYLKTIDENYWYAGVGEIYTKYVFRERFSVFGGGYYSFLKKKYLDLFASTNIKITADHEFNPDFRFGFGIDLKKQAKPAVRIWAEYYHGLLPYGTLDWGKVNWFGFAMWINIF